MLQALDLHVAKHNDGTLGVVCIDAHGIWSSVAVARVCHDLLAHRGWTVEEPIHLSSAQWGGSHVQGELLAVFSI